MVSLFKRHLAHQGSTDPLHIRALQTLVVEIEGIINRRPLTSNSDDPTDFEALTPAHLLYPGASSRSSNNILPSTTTPCKEMMMGDQPGSTVPFDPRPQPSKQVSVILFEAGVQLEESDMLETELELTELQFWKPLRFVNVVFEISCNLLF